jgi:hypothetical protein
MLAVADDLEKVRAIIKINAPLWGGHMKRWLRAVMDRKCWYCETRDTRSDNATDHFRPKGAIAEEVDHPGYWWLAFDRLNYRFACTFCNSYRRDADAEGSGGKQAHFPISARGARAWVPSDPLDAERPLLLDPCNIEDTELLWFDETGVPAPRSGAPEGAAERVDISIKLYHWRQSALATARRLAFLEVGDLCAEADRDLKRFEESGDHEAAQRSAAAIARLVRMADRSAEHSASARCALLGLRTLSPSARKALDHM